jgi:hypothetical protein
LSNLIMLMITREQLEGLWCYPPLCVQSIQQKLKRFGKADGPES